jgi:hypothetical protein
LAAGIAVRCGQRLGNLGPGAETGIDQPAGFQPIKRLAVKFGPLGLDDRRAVNGQPQPIDVLEDAIDEFGSASARVQILDPQAKLAPARPRMGMAQDGRKGMAEMEAAGRRRGETCDFQDSLHGKGDRGDS